MATPTERTKSIRDTRELLQMLARAEVITIGGLIQTVAQGLLEHSPLDADLDMSAAALPGVWATADSRVNSSVKTLERLGSVADASDNGATR